MSTSTRIKYEPTHELSYSQDTSVPACNGQPANGHVKTSSDSNGLIIENPAHPLTDEVADALDALRTSHLKALAVAQEPIVTSDMRRQASDLRLRTFRTLSGSNGDLEILKKELREGALKLSDQISTVYRDRARLDTLSLPIFRYDDPVIGLPKPIDHSFWWARTDATVAPNMRAVFQSDGLNFTGGALVRDYDGNMDTSFGAIAKFALQPDRFPDPPTSGVLRSSPHVELFGGIDAYAPDWDLIQGNGIAECGVFLRQTIFRFGISEHGPVAIVVAEATANDVIHIRLMNTGSNRRIAMPGFLALPSVTYNQKQIGPNELWAELEVRFNIHLNCTGASVLCDPRVLLRTFHWSPEPA